MARILLADDDAATRDLVKRALESDGHTVEVTQDGSAFTLRRRAAIVEAIRTNSEWLPKFQEVAPKAAIATQAWTGCKAAWVVGDPAMMWIGLSCEGSPAPQMTLSKRSI